MQIKLWVHVFFIATEKILIYILYEMVLIKNCQLIISTFQKKETTKYNCKYLTFTKIGPKLLSNPITNNILDFKNETNGQ